jgi:CRP-like cAMP-binding protein
VADSKVARIQRVPLFSRCSKKDLQFIASRMDEVSITAGRTLTSEGKATTSFYVVLEGEVEVTIHGRSRARLGAGDFFGEIGMLDRGPATATVVTRTPVEALVMSHAQFRDVIKGNQAIAMNVIATMAERLRADTLV